jgi:hypothetical protein
MIHVFWSSETVMTTDPITLSLGPIMYRLFHTPAVLCAPAEAAMASAAETMRAWRMGL